MDLIDMIKPLSTGLSSAVNESQQHHHEYNSQREKFLGTPWVEPGAAGCEAWMLSIVLSTPLWQFLSFRILGHQLRASSLRPERLWPARTAQHSGLSRLLRQPDTSLVQFVFHLLPFNYSRVELVFFCLFCLIKEISPESVYGFVLTEDENDYV